MSSGGKDRSQRNQKNLGVYVFSLWIMIIVSQMCSHSFPNCTLSMHAVPCLQITPWEKLIMYLNVSIAGMNFYTLNFLWIRTMGLWLYLLITVSEIGVLEVLQKCWFWGICHSPPRHPFWWLFIHNNGSGFFTLWNMKSGIIPLPTTPKSHWTHFIPQKFHYS